MSDQPHLTEDDLHDLPRGAWVRDCAGRDWRKCGKYLWNLAGTYVHDDTHGLVTKYRILTIESDGN